MYDYKLIEAMATVADKGSFDKAAKTLHITQSAVSQRIKLLEDQMGQILLVRTNPPTLTPAGQEVLKHYLQVHHLEDELKEQITQRIDSTGTKISIAINADSLATWFLQTIEPFVAEEGVLLDIRVEDQEQTHKMLKNGEVVGCISTHDRAIQGCKYRYIGCMNYHMVATPAFATKWFSEGLTQAHITYAPAIIFNQKDDLHHVFLEKNLGIQQRNIPAHYIPSSEKFSQFMAAGLGYGLLPCKQSKSLIKTGRLIDLSPGHTLEVKLYWHCWNIKSRRLEKLSSLLEFE